MGINCAYGLVLLGILRCMVKWCLIFLHRYLTKFLHLSTDLLTKHLYHALITTREKYKLLSALNLVLLGE